MSASIDELPDPGEKVWFVIRDGAHEGPYSFQELSEGGKYAARLVWAKGWPMPLPMETLALAYLKAYPPPPEPVRRSWRWPRPRWRPSPLPPWAWALGALSLVVLGWWALRRTPDLSRPEGMDVAAFRTVRAGFLQGAADVPVPAWGVNRAYTRLWLADRSPQSCRFTVLLRSGPEDNLSGAEVALRSEAVSFDHWASFERFTFEAGQRLWPGRYRAEVSRSGCQDPGIFAWGGPHPPFTRVFTADVHAGSATELSHRLAELKRQREAQQRAARAAVVLAWRDVEEKLRTVGAIAGQVEQDFGALLDKKVPWRQRLKTVVDRYTLRYGGFLTNFLSRNEEDFVRLAAKEMPTRDELMAWQPVITGHARRVGFLSMSLIEWLQKGVPARTALEARLKRLSVDIAKLRADVEKDARAVQAVYTSGSASQYAP